MEGQEGGRQGAWMVQGGAQRTGIDWLLQIRLQ